MPRSCRSFKDTVRQPKRLRLNPRPLARTQGHTHSEDHRGPSARVGIGSTPHLCLAVQRCSLTGNSGGLRLAPPRTCLPHNLLYGEPRGYTLSTEWLAHHMWRKGGCRETGGPVSSSRLRGLPGRRGVPSAKGGPIREQGHPSGSASPRGISAEVQQPGNGDAGYQRGGPSRIPGESEASGRVAEIGMR